MLWFWLIAAALAALSGLWIAARAAKTARLAQTSDAEAPSLAVYRRQLAELGELADRDLIAPEEVEAARAEAGRRLLNAADTAPPAESPGSRRVQLMISGLAALAGLTTLSLYLWIGHPGEGDQPYAARLAAWRRADARSLTPEETTALLRDATRQRPNDLQGFVYLGMMNMQIGQPGDATRAFARAVQLAPRNVSLRIMLAQAYLYLGEGKPSPDFRRALQAAQDLDPHNDAVLYFRARTQIADGDVAAGLLGWKALAAEHPDDPSLKDDIAAVEKTGGLPQGPATQGPATQGPATQGSGTEADPAAAPSAQAAQQAFIRAMVARLAHRLEQSPDDPDGWARLIHSYGVLKDAPARAQALARARQLFAHRPADLAKVEAEAK